MGPVLLILAIGFFLWAATRGPVVEDRTDKKQAIKVSNCPPHKWNYEKDYKDQEIMICEICRRRPSYESRD